MQRTPKLLFLSTGDPTRSQMAEGYLRALANDTVIPVSAGLLPEGRNPLAVDVMQEAGIDISSQTSRNVAESLKEHFAYVITICDATKERFPIFPFTQNLLHWSVVDPAKATGPYWARKAIFRQVRDDLRTKVQSFVDETLQSGKPNMSMRRSEEDRKARAFDYRVAALPYRRAS